MARMRSLILSFLGTAMNKSRVTLKSYWLAAFSLSFLAYSFNAASIDLDKKMEELRVQFEKQQTQDKLIKDLEEKGKLRRARIQSFQAEQQCQKLGIDCETGQKLPEKKQAKKQKTTDDEIKEIQEQQRLIEAKRKARIQSFQREQECQKLGIDCETGEKLPEKKQVKKQKTIADEIKEIQEKQRLLEARLAFDKKQEECEKQGLECGAKKTIRKKIPQKIDKIKTVIQIKLPKQPMLVGFLNKTALFSTKGGQIKAFELGEIVFNGYKINEIKIGEFVVVSHPDSPKLIRIDI